MFRVPCANMSMPCSREKICRQIFVENLRRELYTEDFPQTPSYGVFSTENLAQRSWNRKLSAAKSLHLALCIETLHIELGEDNFTQRTLHRELWTDNFTDNLNTELYTWSFEQRENFAQKTFHRIIWISSVLFSVICIIREDINNLSHGSLNSLWLV